MRLGQVRGGEIQPGSPLLVETMWQVSTTPIKNYSVSAQLLDETGRRVAQATGVPLMALSTRQTGRQQTVTPMPPHSKFQEDWRPANTTLRLASTTVD